MFFSNQIRYTKYLTEGTQDPTQENQLFTQVKSHTLPLALYKALPFETEGCSSLICLVKQKRWEACWQLETAVLWENSLICQERLRETSILWKTTSSLVVQSLLLQHIPPGRLIRQEGQEQKRKPGRQQKGMGKSRAQRTEKEKVFARAVKNPAQRTREEAKNQKHRQSTLSQRK